MSKVLISDKMSSKALDVFKRYPEIQVDVKTGLPEEELCRIIGEYDGLIIRSATKVTAKVLETASRLKIIARAGSGVDNIDVPVATAKRVYATNTPGGNTVSTAEHAIAMMMALTRHIPQGTASLKAGQWIKSKLEGREVFGKTLGVIGAGNVGKIVIDRALGLRMKVVVFDRFEDETLKSRGVEYVPMDDLLTRSDYITIHLNKSKETTGILSRASFEKMKKGVFLINCSRGGIVDEEALYEALTNGIVAGAALDVFSTEPPPAEFKLLTLDSVIATPHLGASTKEAQENVAVAAAEQVADFLTKGEIRNAVNGKDLS